MIHRAVLSRIDRPAIQGRTRPVLAAIETGDGEEVEVFVKLSAGCEHGVTHLAREVIAACLAADLGLPVPRPWLVEIPPEILPAVADARVAELLRSSATVAFGSTHARHFEGWTAGHRLTEAMRPIAAAILLFDAIIQNPDRGDARPNCLVRGDDLRIIDHELCFFYGPTIIGWRAPWLAGGMRNMEMPGQHIFTSALRGMAVDFAPMRERWSVLFDGRLEEYARSIPPAWAAAGADIGAALKLIADARNNIDACIRELRRVLS